MTQTNFVRFAILLLVLFSVKSCEDVNFIPNEPDLLISKVYFNETDLVAVYNYNEANQLIRRTSYNPTSLLVSVDRDYEFNDKGLLSRISITSISEYGDDHARDTSNYSEVFIYDDLGWLMEFHIIYGSNSHVKIFFVYDSDRRIIESHVGELTYDESICEDFDPNSGIGIDPILYTTHEYDENNNVIVETAIHCGRQIKTKPKYDDFKRPNDGLNYIPRFYDIAGFSLTRLAYTLSENNVIDNDELRTFEYQYNDSGYPTYITSYYNGHKSSTMQIEYLAAK